MELARARRERVTAFLRSPAVFLVIALAGAAVAYFPTLRSPFYLDDYIYLRASRDLPFSRYAELVFTPWSRDATLPFTRDFWRPLSFLYFELVRPVFGDRVLPYHLVNLAIHLVSMVMVSLLARKLDPRPAVAAVAVLVFAFYPGSTEAVSWISSINSAGLPFMLGSWLVFLTATNSQPPNWRRLAVAAWLFAVALMFRETSAAVLLGVGLWYLLVQSRPRLTEWRTHLVFLPYLSVCVAYYLLRTRLFTEPAANPDLYGFSGQFDDRWWYYIKNVLLPFRDPVTGWRTHAQTVSGVIPLAVIPASLLARRWAILALSLAIPLAVIPSAAALLGAGQRYFYFLTPLLAVGIGLAVADALDAYRRRRGANALPAALAPALAGVVAILGAAIVWDRNEHWSDIGPEREQAWVDELRAEYPALPAGGTLYCVNVPLELALFEAANLAPVVLWYYPEVRGAVWAPVASNIPPLGPTDRVFIAGGGQTAR
jgi:hypothetical protein